MPSAKRHAVDPPEWTPDDFARAKPFPGDLPATVAQGIRDTHATAQRRRRGAQHAPTKVAISLRVQRDTLARYRASGRGWQTRMAAVLDRNAKRLKRRSHE